MKAGDKKGEKDEKEEKERKQDDCVPRGRKEVDTSYGWIPRWPRCQADLSFFIRLVPGLD